jgi:hypothetical protein
MTHRIPSKTRFQRFNWKWLFLFSGLFIGLLWVILTPAAVEAGQPAMPLFISVLRYAIPIALVIAVGAWLVPQFEAAPQYPR